MRKSGTRPLIGITVDSEDPNDLPGGYSKFPWYALRENYSTVVVKAGGMPLILPNEPAMAEAYADHVDGLIITGGAFDVYRPFMAAERATRRLCSKKTERTLSWALPGRL